MFWTHHGVRHSYGKPIPAIFGLRFMLWLALLVGPIPFLQVVVAGPEHFDAYGFRSELRLVDSNSPSVDRSVSPQVRGGSDPFTADPVSEFQPVLPGINTPTTLGGGYLRINNPNQTGAFSSLFLDNQSQGTTPLQYADPTQRQFTIGNIFAYSNSNLLTETNVNIGDVVYEYDVYLSDLGVPGVSDAAGQQGRFTFRGHLGGIINTTTAAVTHTLENRVAEAMVNGMQVQLEIVDFPAPELIVGSSSGLATTYTPGAVTVAITLVPEPGSIALVLTGGLGMALWGWRQRHQHRQRLRRPN